MSIVNIVISVTKIKISNLTLPTGPYKHSLLLTCVILYHFSKKYNYSAHKV